MLRYVILLRVELTKNALIGRLPVAFESKESNLKAINKINQTFKSNYSFILINKETMPIISIRLLTTIAAIVATVASPIDAAPRRRNQQQLQQFQQTQNQMPQQQQQPMMMQPQFQQQMPMGANTNNLAGNAFGQGQAQAVGAGGNVNGNTGHATLIAAGIMPTGKKVQFDQYGVNPNYITQGGAAFGAPGGNDDDALLNKIFGSISGTGMDSQQVWTQPNTGMGVNRRGMEMGTGMNTGRM